MVSEDDFKDWLGHPITEEVFKALKAAAEHSKFLWQARTWSEPFLSMELQVDMALLKAKSQTYEDLSEMSYEDFLAWSKTE